MVNVIPRVANRRFVSAFLAAAALTLLPLFQGGALRAQEPESGRASNPAFMEWQKEQKERAARVALGLPVEPKDSRFGRVPPPFLRPKINGPISEMSAKVQAGLAVFSSLFDPRVNAVPSGIVAPVPPIRDQNPYGTCWAFAALASSESSILMSKDLSEWHLAYFAYTPVNGMPAFTKDMHYGIFDQGGHDWIATAILSRGTGPVEESYAPYRGAMPNGTEPRALGLKSVYMYEGLARDDVKYLVQTYGALGMSFYYADSSYHSTNHTYRYVGSQYANHAVNIVGWDDNYDRTKFRTQPSANGAWIVRNSWGTGWGESGYFYMSYDSRIDDYAMYIPCALPANQKIYQYDTLGAVDEYGYGSNTAWFSNIFTATGDESLTDVAFYTAMPNAEYEIYIKTDVTDDPGTGALVYGPQSGTLDQPGYRQVTLSVPVAILEGTKFAVIVKLKEQGNNKPINVARAYSGYSNTWTSTPGVGFMSPNGTSWTDAASLSPKMGVCLKAFTVPFEVRVGVSPKAVTLETDGTHTFTVTTGSANTAVVWTVSDGSITQGGEYTAPPRPGTYTITAISLVDTSKSDTATVTVVVPEVVSVSPKDVAVITGGTQTFTAEVTGADDAAVAWTASGGTITANGEYHAPATPGTYTVTATSLADASKSDTATVTVAETVINISDPPKGMFTGGAFTFHAAVQGLSNATVTWDVVGGGSIAAGGVFTAPAVPSTCTITATCEQVPSLQALATVKISEESFDDNTKYSPDLLGFALAFGSTAKADLELYDFDNSGRVDNGDLTTLFAGMGW